MSGFDIILAAVILIAIVVETFRGFGKAVFDGIGLYIALVIAHCAYLPLSAAVHFHNGAADNHACAYAAVFGFSSLAMLFTSRYVYGTVLYTAGVFEQLGGVVAGIAIGLMFCHGITYSAALTDPTGRGIVPSYTNTILSDEVLNFTSYHQMMESLSSFGEDERQTPTVN